MKRIVLGTLLVGLIGMLVVGGVIRTLDKTANVAEARGAEGAGWRGGQGENGQAVAQEGRNQGNGALALEGATPAEDWIVYEGTVVQAPAAGEDLILASDTGEEIVIGTGPGYLEEMGLSLQAGEQVQVRGYWEDGEFKAGQVTRLRDGATVALRDTYGRPAWSGAGQRQNAVAASEATSQNAGQQPVARRGAGGQGAGGQGAGGQGAGGQGAAGRSVGGQGSNVQPYNGEGNLDAPGDGLGTGQAQVDEWLTLAGTVTVANADELRVQLGSGDQVVVDGGALRFLQEQGFEAQTGQKLSLTGFYEDGDFEIGAVENLSTGQSVLVRDENGRPLWAGRGWRSG